MLDCVLCCVLHVQATAVRGATLCLAMVHQAVLLGQLQVQVEPRASPALRDQH